MKRITLYWSLILSIGLLTVLTPSPWTKSLEKGIPTFAIPSVQSKTHDVGNILFTVTNYGLYGNGGVESFPSAEWPRGSGVEFLFQGALWIGAIVNNDTLISVGAEGWQNEHEMFPGENPGDTILMGCAKSHQDFYAVFTDTDTVFTDSPNHVPLGIQIKQNSYAWADSSFDDFILFDYTVHNIDTFFVQDVYVGIYADMDVGHKSIHPYWRAQDDITGFMDTTSAGDTVEIPWIMDADGDGGLSQGVMGMKLLSDGGLQFSYNWWLSDSDSGRDWGPHDTTNPIDPPGTPDTEQKKYIMMSLGKIDPNQIGSGINYPPGVDSINDTRFLFSFGPYQLPPGDSIFFAFAIGGGYDLDDLASNLLNAQAIYDSNYTIALPPQPLDLTVAGLSDSSIILSWSSPGCVNDIAGYNLYRSNTSGSYTTPLNMGLIPVSTFEDRDSTLVEGNRYYYVTTSVDTFSRESSYSNEISVVFGTPWIPQNLTAAGGNGFVDLSWDPSPAQDFLGYNLYRSTTSESLYVLIDSLGVSTNYTDLNVTNGIRYYYVVTAVDSLLIESEFSNEAKAIPMGLDSGILVVDATRNLSGSPGFPNDQQVDDFYDLMLTQAGVISFDTLENSMETNPVTLVDFSPYSTVIWHTDDLSPPYPSIQLISDLKDYLGAGGKLWLVGYRILAEIWNRDSLFADEYLHFTELQTQGANDFVGSIGIFGYPTLEVDPNKVVPAWSGKLRNVSIFSPINPSETIYLFNSASSDTQFQVQPTALCRSDSIHVASFGFPLYPMTIDSITGEPFATMARMVLECLGETSVGVEDDEPIGGRTPPVFALSGSHPNPFHHHTSIRFQLPNKSSISLKVYDISGRHVRTLLEMEEDAGFYNVRWDGRDETQNPVSSGIYFIRFSAQGIGSSKGEFTKTQKVILIR